MNHDLIIMILLALIIISFPVYMFVRIQYKVSCSWIAAHCTIRYSKKCLNVLNNFWVPEICAIMLAVKDDSETFSSLNHFVEYLNAEDMVTRIVNDTASLIEYQLNEDKIFDPITGPARTIAEYIDLPIHKIMYYYFKGTRKRVLIQYVFRIIVSVVMSDINHMINTKEANNGTDHHDAKGDLPSKEGVDA